MNIDVNKVKIIVTIFVENLYDVKNAICEAGARIIGNLIIFIFSTILSDNFYIVFRQQKNQPDFIF